MRTVYLNGTATPLGDSPLKSGGQAAVFAVQNRADLVVKLYRERQDAAQERRLERMLAMRPLGGRPTHHSQPPELAWPTAVARDADHRFLGYAMPKFGEPEHVRLVALFSRAQRLRLFPEQADWRFLLGVSWNLAFMTMRMHHDGLVVGDFSSNNVVVDRRGFVTFLDCDSIAFTDPASGESFPCVMQTADYCPPERLHGAPASAAGDNFALAVLTYQLLTAGDHPFGGVPQEGDDEGTVKDNIVASRSYVVRPEKIKVPRSAIDPTVLPPGLLTLAQAAFGPGVSDPQARPSAADWLQALQRERDAVQVCRARPRHAYGSHLPGCPWCARFARNGQDPFNPSRPGTPVGHPAGAVPTRPGAGSGASSSVPGPPRPAPLPARNDPMRALLIGLSVFAAFVILTVIVIVLSGV